MVFPVELCEPSPLAFICTWLTSVGLPCCVTLSTELCIATIDKLERSLLAHIDVLIDANWVGGYPSGSFQRAKPVIFIRLQCREGQEIISFCRSV